MRRANRVVGVLCALAACGDDGGTATGDGGTADVPLGARPHPQYPPLDLDTLPGTGGSAIGPYTPPTLPTTTREVMVTTTGQAARNDLQTACDTAGTAVTVPDAAGRIGVVNIGNVNDCDITLGAQVIIDLLVIGSLPGPMEAPSHRVRIRGGQVGSMLVIGGSSDLVFDGVAFDNGVVPSASRTGTAIYMPTGANPADVVERMVVVNSIIRLVAVASGADADGTPYLGARTRNLMFANNNIVTAGNRNSWGFRLSGADNTIIIDNTVRVSFHKLVRMNDAPVDYVYIKGGTWMRENTLTSGGLLISDSFTQLGGSTTDHVYIHDPTVYLMPDSQVTFGMAGDSMQAGKSWEARRISWHALNMNAINDSQLTDLASNCTPTATCDYGVGTHTYAYDAALALPTTAWRNLPGFTDDNPDNRPVEP